MPVLSSTTRQKMLTILYNAVSSPLGLLIRTNNIDTFRANFALARRESGDPILSEIKAIPSPDSPNEVWLIKKGKKVTKDEPDEPGDLPIDIEESG